MGELAPPPRGSGRDAYLGRSEEHTSELQSRVELVCRRLLEKKNGCRVVFLQIVFEGLGGFLALGVAIHRQIRGSVSYVDLRGHRAALSIGAVEIPECRTRRA